MLVTFVYTKLNALLLTSLLSQVIGMCFVCTIFNVVAAAFSPLVRKKHGEVHGTFCCCHVIYDTTVPHFFLTCGVLFCVFY